MKIRSATFFHEPRSGKESGKETVLPLSAMLAKNKGQPPIKRTVLFYKTLLLWSKQEQILHFSSSLDGRHYLSVPPFEVHIITIDVSVATSHLGIHPAFHHLSTPHIVGKCSQEQRVTTETTEHGAELSEVRAQQGIGLPFRHSWRKLLARQQLVSISDIRMVLRSVQTLVLLDAGDSQLKT